jgi:hypothetical protein
MARHPPPQWSNDELTFASNKLETIDLYRADCLSTLRIWAPSLTHLNVQASDRGWLMRTIARHVQGTSNEDPCGMPRFMFLL